MKKRLNKVLRRIALAILKKQDAFTMDDIMQKVRVIAEKMNEDYYSCAIEFHHNYSDELEIQIRGYVHGLNWCEGPTVESMIAQLDPDSVVNLKKDEIDIIV